MFGGVLLVCNPAKTDQLRDDYVATIQSHRCNSNVEKLDKSFRSLQHDLNIDCENRVTLSHSETSFRVKRSIVLSAIIFP